MAYVIITFTSRVIKHAKATMAERIKPTQPDRFIHSLHFKGHICCIFSQYIHQQVNASCWDLKNLQSEAIKMYRHVIGFPKTCDNDTWVGLGHPPSLLDLPVVIVY